MCEAKALLVSLGPVKLWTAPSPLLPNFTSPIHDTRHSSSDKHVSSQTFGAAVSLQAYDGHEFREEHGSTKRPGVDVSSSTWISDRFF
jgi:hypothetical protein